MYVVSQKDILDQSTKDDAIAVSSFPIDSHDCQRVALKGGGVINEGTIFPVRMKRLKQGYPYHVPYRSILPRPEQCNNLLVPVALSCTHVGISSLRIEGTWMVIAARRPASLRHWRPIVTWRCRSCPIHNFASDCWRKAYFQSTSCWCSLAWHRLPFNPLLVLSPAKTNCDVQRTRCCGQAA